jgi:hypothetical protein
VIGLWSGSVGAAAIDEPPGQQADQSKHDNTSELVCTREHVMGSNIKKKICRTRTQIEEQQQSSQEAMSEITSPRTRAEGA